MCSGVGDVMGLFQKLALFLGIKRREVNVLVIGLNNSGKSTVINQFKNEEDRVTEIVPTVGFNVEKFQSNYPLIIVIICTFIFISDCLFLFYF